MAAKKEEKYLVLKWEDIEEGLTASSKRCIQAACDEIAALRQMGGLDPHPKYIVCNQDEPYAEQVWETILRGEDAKVPNASYPTNGG